MVKAGEDPSVWSPLHPCCLDVLYSPEQIGSDDVQSSGTRFDDAGTERSSEVEILH
jgi:hypothetical protein